ncbi:hypothetical protein [Paraburkholderia bryophila]|uniref:Uncharacterized protein n=1 Tax=Paraburkholderia bryophila TaxID=420952 RepID=A0A7Y9WE21_9BURK|nr:hypothetical protein [Paraburkholderia bryophila]NYH19149.1 hypothetical protein [Paraburkholderia bryophila]
MANTIDNFSNNMPYDFGDTSMPQQNGMQFNANFSTVPMFPPDDDGGIGAAGAARGAGGMRQSFAVPGQNVDPQGLAGAGAGGGGGAGGMGMGLGGIMNIVKSVLSAVMQLAPPLLGMMGSLMGGLGTQGGQGNGTA